MSVGSCFVGLNPTLTKEINRPCTPTSGTFIYSRLEKAGKLFKTEACNDLFGHVYIFCHFSLDLYDILCYGTVFFPVHYGQI